TPPVVLHIWNYFQYGVPLGYLIEYILILIFLIGGQFVLAAIRGYFSYKLEDRAYKEHLINKIYSLYTLIVGLSVVFILVLVAIFTDYSTINSYIAMATPSELNEYGTIIGGVLGFFIFLILLFVIGGVRGFKKVNAVSKRNNPNIIAKIFIVLFLILTIGVASYLPSISNNAIFIGTPTIPEEYTANIGPWVEFGPQIDHKIASTSNSMVIWWFTVDKKNSPSILKYGITPNINEMANATENPGGDGKHHVVTLTGLSAATRYFYTVPDLGNEIYNFTTGPELDSNASIRIACVGDTRNSGGNTFSFYGYLEKVMNEFYRNQGVDYNFTINVGDVDSSGSDLDSWELYLNQSHDNAANHPYMITIGNHELGGDGGANFDYLYPQGRYYSFNYGNVHFLHINTFDGIVGNVGPKQLAFVENDLKENTGKRFIFVDFHVPPISTGDFNMNQILIAQLFDMFTKYKVDVVITGHDHHYDSFLFNQDQDYNGTFYFVNGGGGAPLDDYIMTRAQKQWLTWYHNRSSEYGLYQHDEYTEKGHIYGELSHGFMDIKVEGNKLNITYYRWLSVSKYFNMTGQDVSTYKLLPINSTLWAANNLDQVTPVLSYVKYRDFN
ncbi:MAG: purple acid phosphatase family protein, partial [Promethearchaeota archaeon]